MRVNGQMLWCSLGQAGAHYDNGFVPVTIGELVIDALGSDPRPMTDEDRQAISHAADDYSDSK
jgi:hypothetical protein